MKEIRIIIRRADNDFSVVLKEESGAETSGTITAAEFQNGFDDIRDDEGNKLSPRMIREAYDSDADALANPERAGEVLFRLITPGTVPARWRALRAGNDSVATLLEFQDAEWANLPWELLYDTQSHIYLNHHAKHTIGHAIPGGGVSEFAHNWPLRMLIVVGCHPTLDADIGWEEELREIEQAAGAFSVRLDPYVVRYPTCDRATILSKLKAIRPHIFHFIGHGSSDDGGSLTLALDGENVEWPLNSLNADLSNLDSKPRIVVLNACQGAQPGGELMTSSTASAFTDCKCAAVVAMRGDVRGKAAAIFSRSFYNKLAETGLDRVDLAYTSAVAAIEREPAYGPNSRMWSLPRIFYSGKVSDVFPVPDHQRPCSGFQSALGKFPDLAILKTFVNQQVQRQDIHYGAPAGICRPTWFSGSTTESNVMVITGQKQTGKSWLLKSCVYTAHLEGYSTFYLNFRPEKDPALAKTKTFEDFLKSVIATGGNHLFNRGLFAPGDPAFEDFKTSAERFLSAAGGSAPPTNTEDIRTSIIEKLMMSLRRASSDTSSRKIFIAMDNIDSVSADAWGYVMKGMVSPLASDTRGSSLRIGVTLGDMEACGFSPIYDYFIPKPTQELPAEEFTNLLGKYYKNVTPLKPQTKLMMDQHQQAGPWPIRRLEEVYQIFLTVEKTLYP